MQKLKTDLASCDTVKITNSTGSVLPGPSEDIYDSIRT